MSSLFALTETQGNLGNLRELREFPLVPLSSPEGNWGSYSILDPKPPFTAPEPANQQLQTGLAQLPMWEDQHEL